MANKLLKMMQKYIKQHDNNHITASKINDENISENNALFQPQKVYD